MALMQQKWCLGGRALPLLHWTASKVDLHEVTGEADVDDAPLLLLNFKSHSRHGVAERAPQACIDMVAVEFP